MRPRDENKMQSIREKAVEMIAHDGLEGFAINKLAKAAGVSPATIYIYYKDKEDLILSLCAEQGQKMSDATLKNFDPGLPFAEGLWIQWQNRSRYSLRNRTEAAFFDQLGTSVYRDRMVETITSSLRNTLGAFMHNCIKRGEINPMELEVYWSIAFAPLYTLVRFHNEGQSIGGKKFVLTPKIMRETFDLVLKALMK